jgi:hypothetical protein
MNYLTQNNFVNFNFFIHFRLFLAILLTVFLSSSYIFYMSKVNPEFNITYINKVIEDLSFRLFLVQEHTLEEFDMTHLLKHIHNLIKHIKSYIDISNLLSKLQECQLVSLCLLYISSKLSLVPQETVCDISFGFVSIASVSAKLPRTSHHLPKFSACNTNA